jgi:hypothetical protein
MILRLLSTDVRYWHSGYFVRIFEDAGGFGWQIFRDNKFIYRGGQFIALVDGGHCQASDEAHRSAQEYIDNSLRWQQ